MKKTIIPLLALVGTCSAVEYASNSVLAINAEGYYWDAAGTDSSSVKDAFTLAANHTAAEITSTYKAYKKNNQTGNIELLESAPIYAAGKESSGVKLNSKSITLSSLYNEITPASNVQLISYSFITKDDGNVTRDISLKVTTSDGVVLGISDVVSYGTITNGTYGVGTFSFDNSNITISSTAAYTYTLVRKDAASGEYANAANLAYGTLNPYYSSGGFTIDGTNGHQPVISIITRSIPEPTTATLSLLALAGLAVRRRRR